MVFIKNDETLSIIAKNDSGQTIESRTVEALLLFEIRYLLMRAVEDEAPK